MLWYYYFIIIICIILILCICIVLYHGIKYQIMRKQRLRSTAILTTNNNNISYATYETDDYNSHNSVPFVERQSDTVCDTTGDENADSTELQIACPVNDN